MTKNIFTCKFIVDFIYKLHKNVYHIKQQEYIYLQCWMMYCQQLLKLNKFGIPTTSMRILVSKAWVIALESIRTNTLGESYDA